MENSFRRKTDSLPTCMSCNSVLYGGFCSNCGQKSTEDLVFSNLFEDFRRRVRELDHPFVRTALHLTRNPGRLVRAYIRGKRLPYVGPFTYAATTAILVSAWVGFGGFDMSAGQTPWGGRGDDGASFPTFVFSTFAVLWVAALVGKLQHTLFPQEKYSVTETWVFGLFTFAHLNLLVAFFASLGAFATPIGLISLGIAHFLAFDLALAGFYRRAPWRTLPAALILETVFIAGIFTSGALFRLLGF